MTMISESYCKDLAVGMPPLQAPDSEQSVQGLHRQGISAVLNILWQWTWLALAVGGVSLGMSLIAIPAALCAAALLAATVGYCWLRRTARMERPAGRPAPLALARRCWETLRSAAPLGWGTLLITILVWTDLIWVRLLRGEQAAGVYAAGNRAPIAVAMLGTFYVQGAFPLLSSSSGKSLEAFAVCLTRTYADLTLLFIPGTFWAMAYAKEILHVIFGRPDYSGAVWVFRIFQITLLMFVANHLLGTGVLVAFHRDRDFRRVLTWTVVAFMILCPLLTWRLGIEGAAIAALSAQFFSFFWFRGETRHLIQLNYFRALLLPSLAGAASVSICRLLHLSLSAGLIAIAFGYFVLLIPRVRNFHLQFASGKFSSLITVSERP